MAQRSFGGTTSAEGVAGKLFGGTARDTVAEDAVSGGGFHAVVERGTGAVEVDVADVAWREAGIGKRGSHGGFGTEAVGVRCGHVVGVGRFASAEQGDGRGFAGEEKERGGFADGDAVAVGGKGTAADEREGFEAVKAVERHAAK